MACSATASAYLLLFRFVSSREEEDDHETRNLRSILNQYQHHPLHPPRHVQQGHPCQTYKPKAKDDTSLPNTSINCCHKNQRAQQSLRDSSPDPRLPQAPTINPQPHHHQQQLHNFACFNIHTFTLLPTFQRCYNSQVLMHTVRRQGILDERCTNHVDCLSSSPDLPSELGSYVSADE